MLFSTDSSTTDAASSTEPITEGNHTSRTNTPLKRSSSDSTIGVQDIISALFKRSVTAAPSRRNSQDLTSPPVLSTSTSAPATLAQDTSPAAVEPIVSTPVAAELAISGASMESDPLNQDESNEPNTGQVDEDEMSDESASPSDTEVHVTSHEPSAQVASFPSIDTSDVATSNGNSSDTKNDINSSEAKDGGKESSKDVYFPKTSASSVLLELVRRSSQENLQDSMEEPTTTKASIDSVSSGITVSSSPNKEEGVPIAEFSRRLSIASAVSMVSMASLDTCSSAGHSSDDNNYKKELFKFFQQNGIADTHFTCTLTVTHPEYAGTFSSNAYSTMEQCESEICIQAYQHVIAVKSTLPQSSTTRATSNEASHGTRSNGKRDLAAFLRKKTKVQDTMQFLTFETILQKPFQFYLTINHPDFPGRFMSDICGKKKDAESDVCFKALKCFLDELM